MYWFSVGSSLTAVRERKQECRSTGIFGYVVGFVFTRLLVDEYIRVSRNQGVFHLSSHAATTAHGAEGATTPNLSAPRQAAFGRSGSSAINRSMLRRHILQL